ncbi:MAG: bifunctional hydroxymethylpyrimidine kinase/phosphomethylpyrimidine kinase [Oscillospiraceae bacterium]|nr:bifunctional hydroxymethylpyrimidine kinase/phosphomethylpyrimidine kinase [Oscillospiraceae bacterium]
MKPRIVWTIAGSDSSGGAGIQADLKTFAAHGCYGCSAITALTAQNTRGLLAIHTPPPDFLARQLESLLPDFKPDAIKIGMLPSAHAVQATAEVLRRLPGVPVVLDPVLVATSGAALAGEDAVALMRRELFPLATLLTPNLPEAQALTGLAVACEEEMQQAAQALSQQSQTAVLLKGGHLPGEASDLLWQDGAALWLRGPRIGHSLAHGTGCTLSSAIACRLAQGHSLPESVRLAKAWLTQLLREKPAFTLPNGPLLHRQITETEA